MKENHEDELNFQENLGHFENGLILWKHNRDAASVYNLDSVFECIEQRISMIRENSLSYACHDWVVARMSGM